MSSTRLELIALAGMGEVRPGDALDALICEALVANGLELQDSDLVAVCQKIVSKAEGRYVDLASVEPSPQARSVAASCQRDPRIIELILRESTELVRATPQAVIARHRRGFVVANAGIDQSNLDGDADRALLLPEDPDATAAALRVGLRQRLGVEPAVLITDSFGRPFRQGVAGVALGASGLNALQDQRSQPDRAGRPLRATQVAIADQLAAAAVLLMGEADQGCPVVLVRGLKAAWRQPENPAANLVRPAAQDLFR